MFGFTAIQSVAPIGPAFQPDMPSNGGGPSRLQSARLVAAVAELGSLGRFACMEHPAPASRKWSSRACLIAGIIVLAWALIIYPIAFEYASREHRANVAGGSRLAFITDGFPRMASGWFTVCLLVSSALAVSSYRLSSLAGQYRRIQIGVFTVGLALLLLHVAVDGPRYVGENAWHVIISPSSFHWPLDYFSLALERWGSWP